MSSSIRIVEMPDLGSVTDSTSFVGEQAGSGRFAATALRAYCEANVSAAMAPVVAASTIASAVSQLGNIGSVTTNTPVLQFTFYESLATGTGFFDAIVVNATRTGGSGHRQAFTAQLSTSGGAVNENLVGAGMFSFITAGSGVAFGGNSFARTGSGAASTSECISFEANTDARGTNASKVGIQVIDVSTSVGDGSNYSAGLIVSRQPGGLGYRDGILFGDDFTANMGGARNYLIRTGNAAGAASAIAIGIDFRTATFTGAAIALPVATNAGIFWSSGAGGAPGGGLQSDTSSNGPMVHFGNNGWSVVGASGATALALGTAATPTVSLYVTGVGMRQVTAGAADSGGAGNRTLIVPN